MTRRLNRSGRRTIVAMAMIALIVAILAMCGRKEDPR
jgi:hypothetical protein